MKYNAFNTHHCYGGIWEQAPGLRKKASSQKGGSGLTEVCRYLIWYVTVPLISVHKIIKGSIGILQILF